MASRTNRWFLIETFSGARQAPTVLAKGREIVKMRALSSVMGSSRYYDDVAVLVAAVESDGTELRTLSRDGSRQLIGVPLTDYSGHVNGVYAWSGGLSEQPPPRDLAGAWYFNLSTGKIGGSDGLLDLYGVAPEARQLQKLTAEAFDRLQPHADEAEALALLIRARPGDEHQATWIVVRDDGVLRAVNLACRVVREPQASGTSHVVVRGITHDLGDADESASASRTLLERAIVRAERRPGRSRAIIHPRSFGLIRWVDPPFPGIAWKRGGPYTPAIHPRDLDEAKRLVSGAVVDHVETGTLRVRAENGGWLPVALTVSELVLDHRENTTALLVIVSAAANGAGPAGS